MWIQGRYSDISRNRSRALGLGFFAWALCAFSGLLFGCVVTDKIEFEEAVNQPFAILARDPEGNLVQGDKGSVKTVSVTVWDPDFDEIGEVSLAGKLVVRSDLWTSPMVYYCPAPVVPEADSETTESEGIAYLLSCPFNLPNEVPTGSLLEFTLIISDLGFYRGGEPRAGAYTAEMNWVIQMR